jgi:hypothetical protein
VLPTVEWFDGESLTRLDQPPGARGSVVDARRLRRLAERVDHAIVAVAFAGERRATFQLDAVRFARGGQRGC